MTTTEEKRSLRRHLRAVREAIPHEERHRRDRLLIEALSKSQHYLTARVILAYAPFGFEIDVMPLLHRAIAEGKRVALPLMHGKGEMSFHFVDDLETLTVSAYGIREPSSDAPRYECGDALCLVPALAYDEAGYRIGYGGGYYDRFLASFSGTAIGIGYHDLIQKHLPRDFYDRSVPLIATECGLIIIPNEPR